MYIKQTNYFDHTDYVGACRTNALTRKEMFDEVRTYIKAHTGFWINDQNLDDLIYDFTWEDCWTGSGYITLGSWTISLTFYREGNFNYIDIGIWF